MGLKIDLDYDAADTIVRAMLIEMLALPENHQEEGLIKSLQQTLRLFCTRTQWESYLELEKLRTAHITSGDYEYEED